MVKYTQLRAAAGLEERIDHLVTMNALPPDVLPATRRQVYADIFTNRLECFSAAVGILLRRPRARRRARGYH